MKKEPFPLKNWIYHYTNSRTERRQTHQPFPINRDLKVIQPETKIY